MTRLAGAVAFLVLAGVGTSSTREIASYAFVNPDGSLRVSGVTVRLAGVALPAGETVCDTRENPPLCGSRASVALQRKIGSNFVHCATDAPYGTDPVTAFCTVDGDDLGAFLVEQGWAQASPDAPPAYLQLQRQAQARGVGSWGFQVDRIGPAPRR